MYTIERVNEWYLDCVKEMYVLVFMVHIMSYVGEGKGLPHQMQELNAIFTWILMQSCTQLSGGMKST